MPRKQPEHYLKVAEAEEREKKLGHLKIYLGAAPGVGKTYQMLSDALSKRAQGLDVVIGVVETHGREDIESMASAFEKIPLKIIEKDNHKYSTLNLDAVINRSPRLVLVDEAAYSNPEGLRHPKRWQDIEELIQLGFDVYTTLNIQHLESLNDVVGRLVGVPIYETVPDSFLEKSSRIELIDLPSEELIARLKDGKVYVPKQAEMAIHHFFKKKNLDALRELALKIAAERVGSELEFEDSQIFSTRLMYQKDKLLVCVNANLNMLQLVRAAKRLASRLNCDWMALYVDTGSQKEFFAAQKNLEFAQSLGAKTHVLMSTNLLKAIELFIEQQQITQLVLGKSPKKFFFRPRLVDKLNKRLQDVGVYSIFLPEEKKSKSFSIWPVSRSSLWMPFLMVSMAGIMSYLKNMVSPWDFGWLTGIFILSIAYFGAWRWVFLLMFSFLGLDLLFNERSFELFLINPWHWFEHFGSWSLLYLVLSAYLIFARREILLAQRMSHDNQLLINFYQILNHSKEKEFIFDACQYLEKQINVDLSVFIFKQKKLLEVYPKISSIKMDQKESGVIQWVYESRQPAGIGTGNLIYAKAYYFPLLSGPKCVGVIRLADSELSDQQKKILLICFQQLANVLDLKATQKQQQQKDINAVKASVEEDVLKHLSQQLYQPFLSLMDRIKEDESISEWQNLLRLKYHLKILNYFSEESLLARKSQQDMVKLIENVLHQQKKKWFEKNISWYLEPDLPEVWVQMDLIVVVIENLLDNILKHANSDKGMEISIRQEGNSLIVGFADFGSGINETELHQLFRSFYKGHHVEGGLGLGLTLCERIITWHGGHIWAENRKPTGAIFYFSIPIV